MYINTLSIYLSVYLSIYLAICLSVCTCTYIHIIIFLYIQTKYSYRNLKSLFHGVWSSSGRLAGVDRALHTLCQTLGLAQWMPSGSALLPLDGQDGQRREQCFQENHDTQAKGQKAFCASVFVHRGWDMVRDGRSEMAVWRKNAWCAKTHWCNADWKRIEALTNEKPSNIFEPFVPWRPELHTLMVPTLLSDPQFAVPSLVRILMYLTSSVYIVIACTSSLSF